MSTLQIEERITVSAPPGRVWKFLLDPARVAACLPGARLDGTEGESTFLGTMKVKVGPVLMEFKGKATMSQVVPEERKVTLTGTGNDKSGGGTAKMDMKSQILAKEDGTSEILVVADVALAGKLVRFGRGMMEGISKQLFKQFSDRVRAALEGEADDEEEEEEAGEEGEGDRENAEAPPEQASPEPSKERASPEPQDETAGPGPRKEQASEAGDAEPRAEPPGEEVPAPTQVSPAVPAAPPSPPTEPAPPAEPASTEPAPPAAAAEPDAVASTEPAPRAEEAPATVVSPERSSSPPTSPAPPPASPGAPAPPAPADSPPRTEVSPTAEPPEKKEPAAADAPAKKEPAPKKKASAKKKAPPKKAALAPADDAPLDAGSLVWAAIWAWLKGLFSRLFGKKS